MLQYVTNKLELQSIGETSLPTQSENRNVKNQVRQKFRSLDFYVRIEYFNFNMPLDFYIFIYR